MTQDYEVFISYRHNPANDLAEAIYSELTSDKYKVDCFRDSEELHFGDFRKQLITYNRRARYLILLLTPGALDRCGEPGDWITKEISMFLKARKPIIVFKINGFRWPEKLPESIAKVKNCDAYAYTLTNLHDTAAEIANCVYRYIRDNWRVDAAREAKQLKQRLSRFNSDINSYYYDAARDFRKYFVFFFLQGGFFSTVFSSKYIGGSSTLMLLFFEVLTVLLIVFANEDVRLDFDRGRVPFIDLIMDYPVIDALKGLSIGLTDFLPILLIMGVLTLGNHLLCGIFYDDLQHSQGAFMGSTLIFLGIPFICFAVKALLALFHLLNSRFGRYPTNYLTYSRLNKADDVLRIVGLVLLIPAIILCDMSYSFIGGGI